VLIVKMKAKTGGRCMSSYPGDWRAPLNHQAYRALPLKPYIHGTQQRKHSRQCFDSLKTDDRLSLTFRLGPVHGAVNPMTPMTPKKRSVSGVWGGVSSNLLRILQTSARSSPGGCSGEARLRTALNYPQHPSRQLKKEEIEGLMLSLPQ